MKGLQKVLSGCNSANLGAVRQAFSTTSAASLQEKVVAVLPLGGSAAKEPRYSCCVENALNLRPFLAGKADLVVTDDKEGKNSVLDQNLSDATIVITTPFHPAYMTRERIAASPNLKLMLTAGIGSDHVDLRAAMERGITVAEVTGSNTVSVAEDVVMRILVMVRNFLPAHEQVAKGEWDVPAAAVHSWDLEGKTVGVLGGGAIGAHVQRRLKAFGVKGLYYERDAKPAMVELGVERVADLHDFLGRCDVVSINIPLTDSTKGMFTKELISKMKKGSWLANNSRGAIVDCLAVKEACESGHLLGYAGDVWDQQPAPKDHPWRTMKNQAMTPHTSGTTLDAQGRYEAGTQSMLDAWFNGKEFDAVNYIVKDGKLARQYQ